MSEDLYRDVAAHVSFPDLETGIMESWAANDIYKRSLAAREGAPEWVFYEGPPTANGKPGIHHVEARTFKDFFCRFRTMRGHYVYRKGGWDCHGLPVEIEVEKELGITQKREIEERVGIEEFTRRCRESVKRYVGDWEKLTERIGFWVDLDDAYWTMSSDYVESVWWILRQIWDKGLLEEDFRVVPYCPRCETSLSNHEQHQPGAYRDVTDPSVYVRFPLADDPGTSLLAWTTTPWTLLANMAAAVGPDITYVKAVDPKNPGTHVIVAKERVEALFGEDAEIVSEMPGSDLVGALYTPPFPFVPTGEAAHRVRPGDFVSTEDGTGIVHIAPYGEEDMTVAKAYDLPIVQIIDASGHVAPNGGDFAGMWFKDADKKVLADLESNGALWASEIYKHAYPHCWRCGTPLIYYARKDWYVRTSQIRDQLQASNEDTNWQPPTIKHGRFGDWLANNVDWSLSRDRYWGTPLPVWRCEDEHAHCIGSFAELSELTGSDLSGMDPHRPHIDSITFPCPECGKTSTRVKAVIDAWFDSGSMPFAQWHYPFENEEIFEEKFPADFISEAIDQTRGWFYSLLAVSTLIEGRNSFKNVVCLGHIVDSDGRKMSKSLGNILDPWVVLDEQGADALRWFLITSGSPWAARRTSKETVGESLRKHLLTLWNTYSFWVTYAKLDGFDPSKVAIEVADRPELDRWILAELDDTIRIMTTALDGFDATTGGRRLERFVDDLSNWYVRRSRRRFWRAGADSDKDSAFLTLWECLEGVSRLSAPFTPFITDEIFTNLTAPVGGPDSVHLADWPAPDDDRRDDTLRRRMGLVRKLVALGRSARTDAKVRVRQPLSRALVVLPQAEIADLQGLEDVMSEELNVRSIEIASGLEDLVSYTIKPNFKALGPRFGAQVKDVAAALSSVDAHAFVSHLEDAGGAEIEVGGKKVGLTRDEVDVRVEGREGFSIAQDSHYGVALDIELTDELIAEGAARETVRGVQDLRKASGLAVEDRIHLWLATDPATRSMLEPHAEFIASETLASEIAFGAAADGLPSADIEVEGRTITVALQKI